MPGNHDPAFTPPQPPPTPPAAGVPPAGDASATAIAEMRAQMAEFQRNMGAFAHQVTQAVTQMRASAPPPPPPPAPSEDAQKFLENPRAFLQDAMSGWYAHNVAPVQRVQAHDTAQQIERELRTAHDGKFGPGSYDKHIAPGVARALAEMGPQADVVKATRSSMEQLVGYARGQVFDTLVTEKSAYDKAQADAASAAAPTAVPFVVGHGGAIRPIVKGEMSESERTYVERARIQGGEDFSDLDKLVAFRDALNSGLGRDASGDGRMGHDVRSVAGYVKQAWGPPPTEPPK